MMILLLTIILKPSQSAGLAQELNVRNGRSSTLTAGLQPDTHLLCGTVNGFK